jgi:hypothetical protein
VHLEPSWSWPKPVEPGGPPVLIGGAAGPKLFAHIAEYADGWIPIGGAGVRAALQDLERACDAVGRDHRELRIVPFGTLPDPGKIEYYESIGVTEIVLRVPTGDADTVLPVLDRIAPLVESNRCGIKNGFNNRSLPPPFAMPFLLCWPQFLPRHLHLHQNIDTAIADQQVRDTGAANPVHSESVLP